MLGIWFSNTTLDAGDMKDIMELIYGRKSEAISDGTNFFRGLGKAQRSIWRVCGLVGYGETSGEMVVISKTPSRRSQR